MSTFSFFLNIGASARPISRKLVHIWMRFPEIGPTGKFELRKQLDEFSMKQLTRKTESHQTIRLQKNDGILVSKWYVTVKYPVCTFSLKTA